MARWDAGRPTDLWLDQMLLRPDTDECIEWPFGRDGRGYAVVGGGNRKKVAYRETRKVSHIVLERDGRPRPGKLFALHSCDNRGCVNKKHLRWGTHAENMIEMVQRGRWAGSRGELMHGITERDGVFAVRQPMWHNLGVVLPEYPTREEAQKIAHNWEPASEPVYRKRTVLAQQRHEHSTKCWTTTGPGESCPSMEDVFEDTFEECETGVLNTRSDTSEELAVVSPTFVTVSNNEMYDVAEVIEGNDPGAVRYETGGTLFGGKKVWLMIRLAEPINVTGDPNGKTIPYFAIQNSHDGSGAFRGQALMDRIVCNNTAQAADLMSEQMGTSFNFSHTKNIQGRIEEAKNALAGWRQSVKAYQAMSEEMVKEIITVDQREIFVEEFIPMPSIHAVSDRVVNNVQNARQLVRDILASPTCEGIDLTTYGLVQASVEYLNHARRANTEESRFKRSYLDRNKIVTDALNLARGVVHA